MSSERSSETMSHSHSLSESFAIIDKVYCFCHKNRLDFTVTMLRRILESLGGVNVEQTVLGLRVLWEMCPSLLNISVHDAQSAELVGGAVDYSIQFLRLRGVGKVRFLEQASCYGTACLTIVCCQKKSKDAREKIVHTILQSFCCGGGAVPAPRPWPEPCPEQADRSKHLGDPCSDLVPTVLTFGDNHEHRIPQENIYGCQYLDCCPDVKNRICFIHKFEKRSASYAELDETLMFPLCCAVRDCFKISKFYKHQAIAINGARERNNVALFSDTSSGMCGPYFLYIQSLRASCHTQEKALHILCQF